MKISYFTCLQNIQTRNRHTGKE